ncbi:MAG: hypothetical protein M3081_00875 [Gemmatimonadota bacterium]|nr:hypothetical protein [Gemmatimonadota bacterium]
MNQREQSRLQRVAASAVVMCLALGAAATMSLHSAVGSTAPEPQAQQGGGQPPVPFEASVDEVAKRDGNHPRRFRRLLPNRAAFVAKRENWASGTRKGTAFDAARGVCTKTKTNPVRADVVPVDGANTIDPLGPSVSDKGRVIAMVINNDPTNCYGEFGVPPNDTGWVVVEDRGGGGKKDPRAFVFIVPENGAPVLAARLRFRYCHNFGDNGGKPHHDETRFSVGDPETGASCNADQSQGGDAPAASPGKGGARSMPKGRLPDWAQQGLDSDSPPIWATCLRGCCTIAQ